MKDVGGGLFWAVNDGGDVGEVDGSVVVDGDDGCADIGGGAEEVADADEEVGVAAVEGTCAEVLVVASKGLKDLEWGE